MKSKEQDGLLPHNLEAEQSVVGAALIDPDAIPRVSSIVKAADFYDPACRAAWAAMLAVHERNEPVDLLTVEDELERTGGQAPLATLMNYVPTSVHAEHYARMVARDAERRALIDAASKITKAAFDDGRDPAEVQELALGLIIGTSANGDGGPQSVSRMMREYYDRIEALARRDGVLGIPTGFRDLDKILGGLQRSDLVILGARPKMGKTSLALCIARNVAKAGKRVLMFSLEMSGDQIMRRLTSLESDVPVTTLRDGKLSDIEWPAFIRASASIDGLPMLIDDTPGITPAEIRARAMRIEATVGPLDLIIVDYLQLMRPDERSESLYVSVTRIGQALKSLAKHMNVPVLALSQLNRNVENRADKRPQAHDLRESGDLEQTANVVLLLFREEVYDPNAVPGLAEVAVAKNRDGPEGTAILHFEAHQTRFANADVIKREIL